VLVAAGLLAGAGGADAHANYVKSNPASDARLVRAPTEVRIVFSEPPEARSSEIQVLDANTKARVDNGGTQASDEPNGLRVSLKPIGDGGYAVSWAATSAVDGHETRGSFAFAVGNADLPAVVDVGEAAPPPRPLEIGGRALSYAGIALLIGGGLFGLVVRREPTVAQDRREQLVLALGGVLLVLASVALLLDQGGRSPPRLTAFLTARGLAGVAVLGVAAALTELRLRQTALVAGVVAALTATFVSHAAASGQAVQAALDLVHATAASAWSGGVIALLAVVLPFGRRLESRDLGALVWRFSLLAIASIAVVSLTGLIQALEHLVLVEDLWETPYGIAILAKSTLFVGAMALAAFNLLRWGPRLRRAVAPEGALRGLGRGVRGEIAAIVVIFVATGALTAFPPPAQQSGAAYDETRHAGGLRLELLAASTTPGQNRFVLRIHDRLEPVTDAQRVAFRFTMIEHDMGENELVAQQRAPGEYVATGNLTSMFGTWRVQTIVRLPERPDVSTVFTIPIGATAAGPGAVARVVSAPPYTLVVYVDPPQPIAGAPVTLSVVLVDAKGDPVPNKTLTAALSGPSSQTLTMKEISVGRYDGPIPALDAGKWTATISVGSEAKADYVFDVAR
jgi:copper transport protein